MSEVEIVALAKQALTTVLLVAGPFIPKIIAVLASILLFGPWMLRVLVNFGSQVLENLHNFVA